MTAALERGVDPRVVRSRQIILRATLEELGAMGYGAFAIESVALRAGVGKSTIYRYWPDKLALIADALETLHEEEGPALDSGSPRERAELILRHVAQVVSDSPFSACLPAMIDAAERDPSLRRFHHEFQHQARQPLIEVLAEGQRTGDFNAHMDPDMAAYALLGAIFFRRLMTARSFDAEDAVKLIQTVLGPAA